MEKKIEKKVNESEVTYFAKWPVFEVIDCKMTSFRTRPFRIDFFSKWSIFDVIDFKVGHFAKWLILLSDLFQNWTIFEAIKLEVIQLWSDLFFEVR